MPGLAIVMIVVHLVLRGWAAFGSWFSFDDFTFMSWVQTEGLGAGSLLQSYGGHLMPSGLLASWINLKVAGLGFPLTAAEMVAGLALADVGALVFLLSAFGRRPGILPPLALFLFTVLTMPSSVWWAVAVNQTPGLIVLFWAGLTHLRYLRTARFRYAVITMVVTVIGLSFQEKTLFAFWLFAFLAVAYFAQGDILTRITTVARRYRAGVALYGAVVLGYVALYLSVGQAFNPTPGEDQPLTEVGSRMGGTTFATGILGGPLSWDTSAVWPVAHPGPLLPWLATALIAAFAYHAGVVRSRSRRAFLLVLVPLLADIVLVTAGRSVLGSFLALEYRYITELAAFSAISVALAVMPLREAAEQLGTLRPSEFLDRPARVATVTALIAALGTVSSIGYTTRWHDVVHGDSYTYVNNVVRTLEHADRPLVLVDSQVPLTVMWAYGYPNNTISHVFRWRTARVTFPHIRTDSLSAFDNHGRLGPVLISAVRRAVPRATGDCPYPARDGEVTVPLDGPVLGTGWWTRVSYYATSDTPLEVTAGDSRYTTTAREGLHSLFFIGGAERMDTVRFSGFDDDAALCISDLEIGQPTAATAEP